MQTTYIQVYRQIVFAYGNYRALPDKSDKVCMSLPQGQYSISEEEPSSNFKMDVKSKMAAVKIESNQYWPDDQQFLIDIKKNIC